jgi:hypothetical protein
VEQGIGRIAAVVWSLVFTPAQLGEADFCGQIMPGPVFF